MNIEVITKEDLQVLKQEIINALKRDAENINKRWLRSAEVREMLNISAGTLQGMRINGTIPYTKLGSTIFYDNDELFKILHENKSA